MPAMRSLRLSALAAALVSALALPAAASADHVACGDTITADTRLDEDLDCSASATNGITIGAPGITLDMDGHTLRGAPGFTGVLSSGQPDVTVEDGTVTGWDQGVFLVLADRAVIQDMTAVDNPFAGLQVFISDEATIRDNVVRGGQIGIRVSQSDRALVARNDVDDNFRGIELFNGNDNVFERNEGTGNGVGLTLTADLEALRNVVYRNRFRDSASIGIEVQNPARDTQVIRNRLFSGAGDGIHIQPGTFGSVLEGNRAERNEGDGIDVDDPDTTLRANRARNNGGDGINAVAGVTDAGANRARRNGGAQCAGLVCRR
jgi:parallel beta-helix repeat protein